MRNGRDEKRRFNDFGGDDLVRTGISIFRRIREKISYGQPRLQESPSNAAPRLSSSLPLRGSVLILTSLGLGWFARKKCLETSFVEFRESYALPPELFRAVLRQAGLREVSLPAEPPKEGYYRIHRGVLRAVLPGKHPVDLPLSIRGAEELAPLLRALPPLRIAPRAAKSIDPAELHY